MRIAIDYTAAAKQGGGIGRLTRGLLGGVAALDPHNQYLCLVARDAPRGAPLAKNFTTLPLPLPERALNILWHRLRVPLNIEIFAGAVDVFHAPNFSLPPSRAARRLVTLHDLTFLRYPDGAAPSLRQFLSHSVPHAARHATRIIADSQATKDDLIEWLKLPAEKISVVYAGVDERFQPITDEAQRNTVRAKYQLKRPFILGVGTLEPRKNYVGLMQAFARAQLPDHELLIAGGRGWLYEPIISAAQTTPRVRLLGFVDDADLPTLYSLASAYCLPSHYEGFGIPCIEAMACGTPVVCSNRPCLPEIVGDAALMVAPDELEGLAAALQNIVNDVVLRQTLIQRGFARAKEFPWSRGARDLWEIYTNETPHLKW
jgi:glycosyltransferase involved in cell wall biosynthesis